MKIIKKKVELSFLLLLVIISCKTKSFIGYNVQGNIEERIIQWKVSSEKFLAKNDLSDINVIENYMKGLVTNPSYKSLKESLLEYLVNQLSLDLKSEFYIIEKFSGEKIVYYLLTNTASPNLIKLNRVAGKWQILGEENAEYSNFSLSYHNSKEFEDCKKDSNLFFYSIVNYFTNDNVNIKLVNKSCDFTFGDSIFKK